MMNPDVAQRDREAFLDPANVRRIKRSHRRLIASLLAMGGEPADRGVAVKSAKVWTLDDLLRPERESRYPSKYQYVSYHRRSKPTARFKAAVPARLSRSGKKMEIGMFPSDLAGATALIRVLNGEDGPAIQGGTDHKIGLYKEEDHP